MKNIEVYLKDLIAAAIRRWFPIMLAGVVLSGASFIVGKYKTENVRILVQENIQALEDAAKKRIEDLEAEAEGKRLELKEQLQILVKDETDLQNSIKESNVAIDELSIEKKEHETKLAEHRQKFGKTAFITISVGIDNPGINFHERSRITSKIIDQYLLLVKYASLKDLFAGRGYSSRSEHELNRYLKVYQENDNTITIQAIRIVNDEGMVLAEKMLAYLQSKHPVIAAATVSHEFIVVSKSVKHELSFWALDRENNYLNRIEGFENAIAVLQNKLTASNKKLLEINETLKPETTTKLDEINREVQERVVAIEKELEESILSEKGKLKDAGNGKNTRIRNAVLFFLAGVFIASVIAIASYIAKLDLMLPDQVRWQLGLQYLGGVRRKHHLFSSGLLDYLSRNKMKDNEDDAIAYVMANIKKNQANCGKILITGTADESVISDFAGKMQALHGGENVFLYGEDPNNNADTLRMLTEADCVVLVERLNVSRLRNIRGLAECVTSLGKNVVGYAVF